MGLILVLVGAAISTLSYLLSGSVVLVAFGLACVMLGLTTSSLPHELTASASMKALLHGSTLSSEKILQEAVSRNREIRLVRKEEVVLSPPASLEDESLRMAAVYLPPKNGLVGVFLPLGSMVKTGDLDAMWNAPTRVTDGRGLLVFPVGAAIGEILTSTEEDLDLEECLRQVVVDSADLCAAIMVSEAENTIVVRFTGVKIQADSSLYSRIMGSIPTSITACVVCAIKKRPAVVLDELISQDRILARLRVE